MEQAHHRFSELFAQLGLANDAAAIQTFISAYAPLPAEVKLEDARCWTTAQAALLRESLQQDADWAELVDQLDVALRRQS